MTALRLAPALLLSLLLVGPAAAQDDPFAGLGDGLYASMDTSQGEMVLKLTYDKTPVTVANFVLLAEGGVEWFDEKAKKKVKRPFFDGLVFHRIIKDFMIQGGCPLGTGGGGPGWAYSDETVKDLKHSGAGILSSANSDRPNKAPWSNTGSTNGSQFFITLRDTPHLDGKHTVFGSIVKGKDVLMKLGAVKTQGSKPVTPVTIKTVRIGRVGGAAKAWKPMAAVAAYVAKQRAALAAKRKLPAAGEPDPARTWDPKGKPQPKVNVQYILLSSPKIQSPFSADTPEAAMKFAKDLVARARVANADFTALVKKYSADPGGARGMPASRLPPPLKAVLTLRPGQVSDPIPFSGRLFIFHRPMAVGARHILISYKGTKVQGMTRTKAQAKELAESILKRLEGGEPWAELLKLSDGPSKTTGGKLGVFTRERMVKPFSDAAFKLKVGGRSGVVETPFGFHIIERTE
jgi:cyclophilin family peptidyl-prolyl cis-trans isomerase